MFYPLLYSLNLHPSHEIKYKQLASLLIPHTHTLNLQIFIQITLDVRPDPPSPLQMRWKIHIFFLWNIFYHWRLLTQTGKAVLVYYFHILPIENGLIYQFWNAIYEWGGGLFFSKVWNKKYFCLLWKVLSPDCRHCIVLLFRGDTIANDDHSTSLVSS